MEALKPYLHLIEAAAIVLIALGLWFGGYHHGRGVENAKCNAERLANAQAANKELAEQRDRADAYAAKLATATDAFNAEAAELARDAATPVHHVLCHAAEGGGSPMPTTASTTATEAAKSGAADNLRRPDFDPSSDERRLHVAFAGALASCYDAMNRWPN
jgi:hypothetical protein